MASRTDLEQLAQVPLFQACDKKQLQQVDRLVERYDAEEGEVMVTEGEVGQELWVLVDGKAEVSRAGQVVATLGPGQWFGELSLLDGARRDATVTMTSRGRLLLLAQRELFGLLESVPAFNRRLLVGLAQRLHEAERLG